MLFLIKNKKIGLGLIFGFALLLWGGITLAGLGLQPDYAQAASLTEFSGVKLASHCTYTSGYYCSGSQRRYRYTHCTTTLVQNCQYGCSGSSCNPPPCSPSCTGNLCGQNNGCGGSCPTTNIICGTCGGSYNACGGCGSLSNQPGTSCSVGTGSCARTGTWQCNGTTAVTCSATAGSPATCSSLGKQCGSWSDTCGGTLNCGGCTSPNTCNSSGQCVCTASTCSSLGKQCGSWSNGCGGTLNCGGCTSPNTCNGSGQCVCLDNGSTCNYTGGACDTTGDNNCGVQVSRCNRITSVAGGWSACSTSCGTGTRTCTNPSPACGGATCSGSSSCSSYIGCTYTWITGSFGSCSSGSCTQTRTVQCQRSDGTIVADSYCNPNQKPATSQPCSINGTWSGSCTVPCGGGTRTCSGASCGGTCTGTAPTCNTQACPVAGACGTANGKTYAYNASGFGSDTFCGANNTSNPVYPNFPAQGGSTSWTCTGYYGGSTASCSAARSAPPFDYSISNSGNITAVRGSSGNNTINATLTSGSTQVVAFSVSGLPFQASASGLSSCNPTCSRTLTISTSAQTPTGTFPITVTSGAKTTAFNLIVNSNFDYTIANSGAITSYPGSSGSNTISANLISGNTQPVSFSASGLPANAIAAFSPTSCNPNCSTTLTVSTPSNTAPGTYSITVTGSVLPRTTVFNLIVDAPPPTPVNLRVTTATPIIQGATVNFAWNTASLSTYYAVQFYPNGTPTGSWIYPSPIYATSISYSNTASLTSLGAVVRACQGASNCSAPSAVVTATITAPTPANSSTPVTTSSGNQSVVFNSGNSNVVYHRIDPDNGSDRIFRLRVSGSGVAVDVVDQNGTSDGNQVITVSASTDIIVRVAQGQTRYIKFTGPNGSYSYTFKRFRNFPYYEGQ